MTTLLERLDEITRTSFSLDEKTLLMSLAQSAFADADSRPVKGIPDTILVNLGRSCGAVLVVRYEKDMMGVVTRLYPLAPGDTKLELFIQCWKRSEVERESLAYWGIMVPSHKNVHDKMMEYHNMH